MKYELILVRLNQEQIAKAKSVNGKRKLITHALICGHHGQMFGTEKQCRKYFDAFGMYFSSLFSRRVETHLYEIEDFESIVGLGYKLSIAQRPLTRAELSGS